MNSKIYSNDPTVKRAALAAFPSYNGRTFAVQAFPDHGMILDSNWSGGSRDYFALINLASLATMPIPQNGTPFDGGSLKLSALPAGAALVKHTIFSGKDLGLTVFVNPADLAPLLPAPVDLTWGEKVVLRVTVGLKPAYRLENAREECGMNESEYDTAKNALISRGYLNRAGAVTSEGRNAASSLPSYLPDLNDPKHGGRGFDRWGMNRFASPAPIAAVTA